MAATSKASRLLGLSIVLLGLGGGGGGGALQGVASKETKLITVARQAFDELEQKLIDRMQFSDLELNLGVARQLSASPLKELMLMSKARAQVSRAAKILVQMAEAHDCDQTLLRQATRVLKWRDHVSPNEREQPTGRLDRMLRQILAQLIPKCVHYLEARYERATAAAAATSSSSGSSASRNKIDAPHRAKLDNLLLAPPDSGHSLLGRRPDNATVLLETIRQLGPQAERELQRLSEQAKTREQGKVKELQDFLAASYEQHIKAPCEQYLLATRSWDSWASWLAFYVPHLDETKLANYLREYQACWAFGGQADLEQSVTNVLVSLGLREPQQPPKYSLKLDDIHGAHQRNMIMPTMLL